MRLQGIALLISLFISLPAHGQRQTAEAPTELGTVIASTLRHYPSILAAQADVRVREGELLATGGAFDPRLQGGVDTRMSGYYNGTATEGGFYQDLPFLNASVFGTYRISDGTFPVYDSASQTLENGELRAGFAISLMRDREIDSERAAQRSASLAVLSESRELSARQITLLQEVYITYTRWLLSWRLQEAYNELLEIALARGEGLQQRVAAGDAAEILLVENNQAVLQRQALVEDARRQSDMLGEQLALYLRNEYGDMLLPVYSDSLQLPEENAGEMAVPIQEVLQQIMERRPEIAKAKLVQEQAEIKLALAENLRKPQVDFRLYGSRDIGSGLRSLAGTDTVADISFSIPLRTREARGKAQAARAEIQGQQYRIRQLMDQLEAEIRRTRVNLEATRRLEELAVSELAVTEQLVAAERDRFEAGLSDFFLLNIRERQIAEAQLKRWQAHLAHHVALAGYYGATMNLAGLGMSGTGGL